MESLLRGNLDRSVIRSPGRRDWRADGAKNLEPRCESGPLDRARFLRGRLLLCLRGGLRSDAPLGVSAPRSRDSHGFGGILTLAMGLKSLISPQGEIPPAAETARGAKLFLPSFAIGIANPAAILTFLFAFSSLGIPEVRGWRDGISLVAGVFLGTYLWWGILAVLTQRIKRRAAKFQLRTMNRIFGGILCAFGILVFLRLFL